MSSLMVEQCSIDCSDIACSIKCFTVISYLSFRRVSIFDSAGNGFLNRSFSYSRENSLFYQRYDTYRLVFRFTLNKASTYLTFGWTPSTGRRKTRETSGINAEKLVGIFHWSQTLQWQEKEIKISCLTIIKFYRFEQQFLNEFLMCSS